MPRKRPVKKGSFGSHLDDLVTHFPLEHDRFAGQRAPAKPRKKPDQGDVHALLFEQAWRLNRRNGESGR